MLCDFFHQSINKIIFILHSIPNKLMHNAANIKLNVFASVIASL